VRRSNVGRGGKHLLQVVSDTTSKIPKGLQANCSGSSNGRHYAADLFGGEHLQRWA
jgi:hypothetical protein